MAKTTPKVIDDDLLGSTKEAGPKEYEGKTIKMILIDDLNTVTVLLYGMSRRESTQILQMECLAYKVRPYVDEDGVKCYAGVVYTATSEASHATKEKTDSPAKSAVKRAINKYHGQEL